MDVAGRVTLRFTGDVVRADHHVDLSAVRTDGPHLWVAGDETATIERLVLDSETRPTRAGRQRSFRLADLVQLPGPPNGEAAIQGMARSGDWLWAVGSHALVRRRPKPEHDEAKVVRRLGKLRRDPNRFVIARLAVQLGVDRRPEPVRVTRDGRRSALVGAPGAETLVDLLRADHHLAPFLAIPSRDNGFDVEGLAVVGERVYVGLRGPVLRGWAVVLELRPVQDPTDPGRLALGIFPEGSRYRKHFLDLGGLGVRDLCADGDDLLVLAGPTMALPGPARVHRWHGAAAADTARVVRDTDLSLETVVDHGEGDDQADGITLLAADPLDPRARLLVVYDSPAPGRCPWPDSVQADRVRIGPDTAAEEPAPVETAEPGAPSDLAGTAEPAMTPDTVEPPEAPAPHLTAVDPPTAEPDPAAERAHDDSPTPPVGATPVPPADGRSTADGARPSAGCVTGGRPGVRRSGIHRSLDAARIRAVTDTAGPDDLTS
jgi:Protein of unknown function (DUF3616)